MRIVLGEAAFEARARAVGTRAVIVAAPEPLDLDGGMVILHFPIPLRDGTSWVRMLCAASPLEGGESLDFKALDLRIVEMLHEGNPGVFERFVRYLCQRMLAQEQDGE